jgi:hypothetical protein
MLKLLDIFFTILHLLIIGFNLFGWAWPKARKFHLIFVALTLASWFILGIWYGMGYCPITDWQWNIKEKLGETDLPNSFIKYFADKMTGNNYRAEFIDRVTLITFIAAIALAIYVNFFRKIAKKKLNKI